MRKVDDGEEKEKEKKKKRKFIVATNVIASRPPKRRPTGTGKSSVNAAKDSKQLQNIFKTIQIQKKDNLKIYLDENTIPRQ